MDPATTQLLFFVAMFAIIYFTMIRPQQKRQSEQKAFVNALQVGDEVATTSGILGKIVKIDDQVVTLDIGVGNKVTIKVTKNAVSKEMTDGLAEKA